MSTIALNCLVYGDGANQIFPVEIASNKIVGNLKDLIRQKEPVRFANIGVTAIRLFQVSLSPEEVDRAPYPPGLELLSPLEEISDVFKDPPRGKVHVVALAPIVHLRCLVLGDGRDKIFTVTIRADEDVSILKTMIKAQKHIVFSNIEATDIQLSKVSLNMDNDLYQQLAIQEQEKLSPSQEIADCFPKPKKGHVHVIAQHPTATEEDHEDPDKVPELPEYISFTTLVATKGSTPSAGAKSSGYHIVQKDMGQIIYDGLKAPTGPSTIAPPITIFHPIFQRFKDLLEDASLAITNDELIKTEDFMSKLSTLPGDETTVASTVRSYLTSIFDVDVIQESNEDTTSADGTYSIRVKQARINLVILELKKFIGDGGGDPFTQASIVARRSWIGDHRKDIREKCCCPTFLIASAGPWLGIMGSVLTDKMIVQRLTDIKWMGLSSTQEDKRVYDVTRIFIAVRECLKNLASYYHSLDEVPPLLPNKPHPRYFPYPNSYTTGAGVVQHFRYLRALEADSQCVTYLAELEESGRSNQSTGSSQSDRSKSKRIVVKFVSQYGKEVHEFLAKRGRAPALHYCGPFDGSVSTDGPAGLHLRSMAMVVMDYIEPCDKELPSNARADIEAVLDELHKHGYVLGDLRRPNIVLDREGNIWFIDFDWSGKYNIAQSDEDEDDHPEDGQKAEMQQEGTYARYPLRMSTVEGIWAAGMKALAFIRPKHDFAMLDKLFS